MSGILGIILLDGSAVDREDLERMKERIRHRGPDGSSCWIDGPVGLGHLMLYTTPESLAELLPASNTSDDLVITADARIDNRDELIDDLFSHKERPEKISDSELILLSYERWGEGCMDKLIGDFAFAIWDRQNNALFCGRDHLGVKPLYYHLTDRSFIFASEIKALFGHPDVPRGLDEETVGDFLVPILDDRERTFYEGIRRLPAAHILTLKGGALVKKRYWSLDPNREIRLSSDDEYAAEFRRIFLEAVRCRLRSAFPVGVSLSGGLDSSSVACSARKILAKENGGGIHTFSAIFEAVPECDEREFIGAVIDQGGFEGHQVRADTKGPLEEFGRYLEYEDEPFWILNYFMSWDIFKVAKEKGIRVIMDGVEGDVVVSHGLTFLIELASAGRLIELCRNLRGLSKNFEAPVRSILWNHCIAPLAPDSLAQVYRRLRGRDRYRDRCGIVNPEFADRTNLRERFESYLEGSRSSKDLREDHYRSLDYAYLQQVLEVTDRQAAAFSLDCRHPFFDKRLVEFCLALPSDQKLRRGWSRWILRSAMSGILPQKIQWRGGKANLSPNFNRSLLAHDGELLKKVAFEDMGAIEDYVDISHLQETYLRFASERSTEDSTTLWKTVTLSLWLSRQEFAKE